jgi:hypothetical protein
MATDAVRHRGLSRKEAALAAKAVRQKVILAVFAIILLVLLAIQGPKTLNKLRGTTPQSAAVPTVATRATSAPSAEPAAKSLKAVAHFPEKDPFVPQLGTQTGSAPAAPATPAPPPAVRTSQFVAKDPFVQQLNAAAAPAVATGSPQTAQSSEHAPYIVLIASVPIAEGRGAALQAAAAARLRGVPSVRVVDSSEYPTLRSGFYAVYSGPHATLSLALSALELVRGHGYPSAYTRRLAH